MVGSVPRRHCIHWDRESGCRRFSENPTYIHIFLVFICPLDLAWLVLYFFSYFVQKRDICEQLGLSYLQKIVVKFMMVSHGVPFMTISHEVPADFMINTFVLVKVLS